MRFYIWVFFIGFLLSTNCYGQDPSLDRKEQARQAIEHKQYSLAISILNQNIAANPEDYDSRFLLARTYGWNKNIAQGLNELDILLKKFPDNSDYLLSKARLLSWQNKNTQALLLLQKAKTISPNYKDIWILEIVLRKKEQSKETLDSLKSLIRDFELQFKDNRFSNLMTPAVINNPIKPIDKKFIGVGYGHEQLDNNAPNWNDFFVNFTNEKKKSIYSIQVDLYNRFDINDQKISGTYIHKNFHNFQFMTEASISTENKLVPNWSLSSQLSRSVKSWGSAEIFYKHNTYTNLNADILRVAYAKTIGKYEPKVHGLMTFINTTNYVDPPGYILQLSYMQNDNTFIRASYSVNNEVEYGIPDFITYEVTSFSIDGRTAINKNTDISLAYIHHIQGQAYKKNGIHTGIRYRY